MSTPVRPVAIDLHVHTRRHSPCAELLDPCALGAAMRRRHLSGVLLAEHDMLWDPVELEELQRITGTDIKFYRGAEVTCAEGHVLVVGLDTLDGVSPGIPLIDLLAKAHAVGAAAILAHPFLPVKGTHQPPDLSRLPPALDAVEVASTMTRGDLVSRALQWTRHRGCFAVAGSDAHAIEHVGDAFTLFPEFPRSEFHLARMIAAGLGRPHVARPSFRGDLRPRSQTG